MLLGTRFGGSSFLGDQETRDSQLESTDELKASDPLDLRGLGTELRDGDPDDPIGAVLAISDIHGNRVDLLSGLRGLDRTAFVRSIEVPLQGRGLRFVSREDFIAMKLFAHGPQDLSDARYALEAAPESLDVDLLERLAAGFGPDTVAALAKLRA